MIALTEKIFRIPELSLHHRSAEQISNEREIIEAAQKDNARFESLYKTYYPRIVSFIYQRVDNKDTAFDITSEVFYVALKNLGTYKFEGVPFSAWLYRIAINKINDLFRKQKVRRTISAAPEDIPHLIQEIRHEERVTDAQLFEALESLEEEEVNLIEMRFFENRAFREICEITGQQESACKMKVYRILGKLKTILKNTPQ